MSLGADKEYLSVHSYSTGGIETEVNKMLGKYKMVALCTARIHDDVNHDFIVAFNKKLTEMGCRLLVFTTCSDLYWSSPSEQGERSIFELINYDILDALVIFSERIKNDEVIDDIISRAAQKNIPVISIGGNHKGCANISFDYETGFEKTVRHMIDDHGYTDCHFVAGLKNNEFSDNRIKVFRKVMAEHGITVTEDMISYGEFWSRPTIAVAEELLKRPKLPEAIICANDTMAVTVCSVFRNHGVNVPEDVKVSGFDGIREILYSIPKITSCGCDYGELAARIAKLIDQKFHGKDICGEHFVVPSLIISESCGCPDEQTFDVTEYLNEVGNIFYRYQEEERAFVEIAAKAQNSGTLDKLAACFFNEYIYDTCCMLTDDCVNETVEPHTKPSGAPFGGKMHLLFDTNTHQPEPIINFSADELVPDLAGRMIHLHPIIFVALNFLDVPMGYVCFQHHDYNRENYIRIPQVVMGLNNSIGGFKSIRYQQYLITRIEKMYQLDALTGLYNRGGFLVRYKEFLEKLDENASISVVLSDLDGLKPINDTYGHDEGDNAISTAAAVLKYACPENALCVRIGGDEMLAVYEGCEDGSVKQRIIEQLAVYNGCSGKPYEVSASVGIYISPPGESRDFEELLKKSDELMYMDKSKKKNRRRK